MTAHDDDDARTVLQTAPGAARGLLPGEYADALPAATRLHEFEIVSVIGQGGFGIVYLAHDLTLDRRVAIKEYMPSAMAVRTSEMTVAVRSSRHAETFAAGLRSFVNEARLLAKFDHPALLKVHRFWEARGTAYMAMPHYAGTTLAQQLAASPEPPDEARLRGLLDPLLDALALMHAADCYHRDIAPDNILILPNGAPLLLDFGAARRVIGNMSHAPTVILKGGYAPVEQYGGMPEMTQGAWTDLYALGSVIEFAINGRTPPQALARYLADKRQPLASACAGRYGDDFLRAIDRCLAVLPQDRPQSVAALRALLATAPARARGHIARPPPAAPRATPERRSERDADKAATTSNPASRSQRRGVAIAGAMAMIAIAAVAGAYSWFARPRVESPPTPVVEAPRPPFEAASASAVDTPPAPVEEVPATAPAPPPTATVDSEPVPASPVPTAPVAKPDVIVPQPHPANASRRTAAPPTHDRPRTAPDPQPVPRRELSGGRCADIIQRVSLGEPLSDGEKRILTTECRQ